MQAGGSFEITTGEVHVWIVGTAVPNDIAAELHRNLDPAEADRAAKLPRNRLANSFVVTRGTLRYLLGRYLDCDPASLRFEYGAKGKPALAAEKGLQFSVSHSGDLAAIALTSGCEIGIDLERVRPLPEMDQIASRYFDPDEAREILSLPESDRLRSFFRVWTRKEAYIKAIGEGLSETLLRFSPEGLPGMLEFMTTGDSADRTLWTLHDLEVAPDYLAAVAYRDRRRSLSVFPVLDPAQLRSPKRDADTIPPASTWQRS
jgi:4'-phosphopantetheinyl transferase